MNPTIRFRCRGCNARIKAPGEMAGQTRICPGCGHRFIVQSPIPPDAGPRIVFDMKPTFQRSRGI